MRAAIFQGPSMPGTPADMLALLDRTAAQAAADGARLLVLPELFLTGYHIGIDALHSLAEPADGPAARRAGAIAAAHGVALLYGYPERGLDGKIYNAALLIGADGAARANYRKTHLWGEMERAAFAPGEEAFVLAEIEGMRVGVLICYDVEFPELVRGLALLGADLVAVPTAAPQPYVFVPETLIRARAYENQIFVMYADRCGCENGLDYVGRSIIAGPDGSVLAQAGTAQAYIAALLDPALRARWSGLNSFLRDRRPALYSSLVAADPVAFDQMERGA